MRPVLLIETTKTIVYFIFFFLAIFQDIRNKALSGRFLLLFPSCIRSILSFSLCFSAISPSARKTLSAWETVSSFSPPLYI